MLLLSHRGYHAKAPENTLDAFAEALELGVDGIETDVRLSADGTPILYHDRIAKNERLVASCATGEISDICGYHVPTLREAISTFPDTLWNLEIKTPSALDATLAVLHETPAVRKVLITSFYHRVVVEACERESNLEGGLLLAHRPLITDDLRSWLPARENLQTIVWWWDICDESLIAAASQQGFRSFVYGPAVPDDLAAIRAWSVDGVITDRPGMF